ncbi:conserved hypothetical protein [Candidatus Desulfosporosinus infrequens]|uniref:DUF2935 domain-containing protein n=1 Tax=Candidatus Desulfosporosinus infrequens TaxID=2043169 RepID=A0A2U3JWQ2_9FIRM|nr:conserved hypothetical protein [Candidatus Desulfosporosinus infrequens]
MRKTERVLVTSSVPMIGNFGRESLDLHLFFARIMREHAIFMQAGFLPKDVTYLEQALQFKCQYDEVLKEAIRLSDCTASEEVLQSEELLTDKTLRAEQKTQELTGISIDMALTVEELRLNPDLGTLPAEIEPHVCALNQKAMVLTTSFAEFKAMVLEQVTHCRLACNLFPAQLEHVYKEAQFYLKILKRLQNNQFVDARIDLLEQEVFWDEIMADHAKFVRHLLDPSERELCRKAKDLTKGFERLEQKMKGEGLPASGFGRLMHENIAATLAIAEFKATGTELILACQVKSLLSPLLTDHTLREANYYLRILQTWRPGYLGRR